MKNANKVAMIQDFKVTELEERVEFKHWSEPENVRVRSGVSDEDGRFIEGEVCWGNC